MEGYTVARQSSSPTSPFKPMDGLVLVDPSEIQEIAYGSKEPGKATKTKLVPALANAVLPYTSLKIHALGLKIPSYEARTIPQRNGYSRHTLDIPDVSGHEVVGLYGEVDQNGHFWEICTKIVESGVGATLLAPYIDLRMPENASPSAIEAKRAEVLTLSGAPIAHLAIIHSMDDAEFVRPKAI